MISRTWISRRIIAILLLFPGYGVGWLGAQIVPHLFPWIPWTLVSPYTVGAIASTAFNTLMWDRWVKLVYRFGGKEPEQRLI